jgi:hypothetical protein
MVLAWYEGVKIVDGVCVIAGSMEGPPSSTGGRSDIVRSSPWLYGSSSLVPKGWKELW